ncbi:DUF4747 family protein [Vibrio alginolyticus]|nr:DUF4747 family protein [Vibrio alginolyticus]
MAIFKFYNIQLLPLDTSSTDEVGQDGYCKLFNAVEKQIQTVRSKGLKLSSMAVKMRGDMYFAPFSITEKEYANENPEKPNKVIHGYFLKFDDIDTLVDTNSGVLQYRSQGNTSNKRFELEFVFDPITHTLAIQDTRGLPARTPLIDALNNMLGYHAVSLFKEHSLEIEELTSADSLKEFLELKKKGYKSYNGHITFSNSGEFRDLLEEELREDAEEVEKELKEKNVAKWVTSFRSFKDGLMSDLPHSAKVQMALATQYGNSESTYTDEDGQPQKYHMEDYPVRLPLKEKPEGILERSLAIGALIKDAIRKTKLSELAERSNKACLKSNNACK